jgi:hypothetical protein
MRKLRSREDAMSEEFGIFGDEGCCERDFYSVEEASEALADRYGEDDDLHVARCCPDHPDEEAESCESCLGDEDALEEAEDD